MDRTTAVRDALMPDAGPTAEYMKTTAPKTEKEIEKALNDAIQERKDTILREAEENIRTVAQKVDDKSAHYLTLWSVLMLVFAIGIVIFALLVMHVGVCADDRDRCGGKLDWFVSAFATMKSDACNTGSPAIQLDGPLLALMHVIQKAATNRMAGREVVETTIAALALRGFVVTHNSTSVTSQKGCNVTLVAADGSIIPTAPPSAANSFQRGHVAEGDCPTGEWRDQVLVDACEIQPHSTRTRIAIARNATCSALPTNSSVAVLIEVATPLPEICPDRPLTSTTIVGVDATYRHLWSENRTIQRVSVAETHIGERETGTVVMRPAESAASTTPPWLVLVVAARKTECAPATVMIGALAVIQGLVDVMNVTHRELLEHTAIAFVDVDVARGDRSVAIPGIAGARYVVELFALGGRLTDVFIATSSTAEAETLRLASEARPKTTTRAYRSLVVDRAPSGLDLIGSANFDATRWFAVVGYTEASHLHPPVPSGNTNSYLIDTTLLVRAGDAAFAIVDSIGDAIESAAL